MIKVGIFMADGCEEIEGLTVVDIVRRAKLEIETISITEKAEVTSSHQVTFKTDTTKAQADFDSYDAIVLPGGMPGTLNLGADETVVKTIKRFAAEGKLVAAISMRQAGHRREEAFRATEQPMQTTSTVKYRACAA